MEKHELDKKIMAVSKTILSYCISRTSNQQDAEDLAQDILYEIVRSAPNLRDERAFYGFMWSVAGNVYKQWYRKKLKVNKCELPDDISDSCDVFGSIIDDKSDVYLLRRELTLLAEKYRRATILYYLKNKSCSEISNLLSVSESMVKYLLFKSRNILKEGINMERNYGKQSYDPKSLELRYMGEGPNKYWEILRDNKIRQNILWACYNDSLTEQEIALQIGVSLPYIEDDLKMLADTWLLKKDGNHYRMNIIIITDEFENEKALKILPYQQKIADIIKTFIDENEYALRSIGFYKSDMSRASFRWHMTTMMLFLAYTVVGDKVFRDSTPPVTAFGEHAFFWGTEKAKGGYNCCSISAWEWQTNISMFFMDWANNLPRSHNDFYKNRKWVKVYDKIAHSDTENLNEFELEVAAEMARKGYVLEKDGKNLPTMPVYTDNQWHAMMDLQRLCINEIKTLFAELNCEIASVLKNHVPTHLKSQVGDIASMCLFNDGTYEPSSILCKNGYLSSEWTPGEIATSYVVLSK